MSTCPLGYGSPENSDDLRKAASKVEIPAGTGMSAEREKSSIPYKDGKTWEYPSPVQFYRNATAKGHEVDPLDMNTVVSIHNAVNEETWKRILAMEKRNHPECVAGPTLIRFVGKPGEPSTKALFMHKVAGYVMPFDRHVWTIDRCGKGLYQYHVDFYDGNTEQSDKVNIYLDVRPAMDRFPGIVDRTKNLLHSLGTMLFS